MNLKKVKDVFEDFKFDISEEVRHKGDTKNYSPDMGLYILSRSLHEEKDVNNNSTYIKQYLCRKINYSSAGQTLFFQERELLSLDDYYTKLTEHDDKIEQHRLVLKQTKQEIKDIFGVNENSIYILAKDKELGDKAPRYKFCGFRIEKNSRFLTLRKVLDDIEGVENIEISSKDEIIEFIRWNS